MLVLVEVDFGTVHSSCKRGVDKVFMQIYIIFNMKALNVEVAEVLKNIILLNFQVLELSTHLNPQIICENY